MAHWQPLRHTNQGGMAYFYGMERTLRFVRMFESPSHTTYPLLGAIVSVRALGNTMVVLNNLEIVSGLLDKRGGKFSYRPRLVMAGEVIGLDRVRELW
jgi:hypothetical protein